MQSPVARTLFAIVGLLIVAGIIALLVLVALPLAILAIGVTILAALASAVFPQLRQRSRRPRSRPQPSPMAPGPAPRTTHSGPSRVKRVEPIEPPRTVE